jgi:hypothetical protein
MTRASKGNTGTGSSVDDDMMFCFVLFFETMMTSCVGVGVVIVIVFALLLVVVYVDDDGFEKK